MKSLTLLIIVWFSATDASKMYNTPKPNASLGICVSLNPNMEAMSLGESKDVVGACKRATCHQQGIIKYEECKVVTLPHNCKFIEPNRYAPFPKCCRSEYVYNNTKH